MKYWHPRHWLPARWSRRFFFGFGPDTDPETLEGPAVAGVQLASSPSLVTLGPSPGAVVLAAVAAAAVLPVQAQAVEVDRPAVVVL